MKKILPIIITVILSISLMVLGLIKGITLTDNQVHTLKILLIICSCSMLYCFVVGEITRNNSQMDKLWSILPIAYVWVIAACGGMKIKLVIIAILVTLWGIRLTYNFARKGAYSLKFWQGVEDYRWVALRKNKIFKSKIVWGLFDLFFISFYQNALVLLMTLPALAIMDDSTKLNLISLIPIILASSFLILELIADEQQWKFHKEKKNLLSDGKSLADLPSPYNLGFNTIGLWNRFRHPNYLGEQGFWFSVYLFVIGTSCVHMMFFNWSIVGAMLIIMLFLGSSTLGEKFSSEKYPQYKDYQNKVFKYLPLRKYRSKQDS